MGYPDAKTIGIFSNCECDYDCVAPTCSDRTLELKLKEKKWKKERKKKLRKRERKRNGQSGKEVDRTAKKRDRPTPGTNTEGSAFLRFFG